MKLFSWMQSKFSAGHGDKRAIAISPAHCTDQKNEEPPNEEFKDWPHGLLSIGTLGYKDHDARRHESFELIGRSLDAEIPRGEECSSPNFSEFTAEEMMSLQKELTKLLRQKSTSKAEETAADLLPLDRFLNCPSSLEVDLDSDNGDEQDIDRTIRIIVGRCRDACEKKRAMGKKSLCFLIKKMFVCRSGFASSPSLRDAFQESRMEKLMRAMLTKKIYPQNSDGERLNERNCGGFKWDKTDSEFIVLEINPSSELEKITKFVHHY